MRLAPLAVALLVAGCLGDAAPQSGPGPAQDAVATLRGVVVDEAIRPLAGATVHLTLADGAQRNATTADDGLWSFPGLAPGAYVLRTQRAGYLQHSTQANVTPGVAEPPALRIVLALDQGLVAAIDAYLFDGYLQCSFTAVAVRQACDVDAAIGPPCGIVGACPQNLTTDDFMAVHAIGRAGIAYIQSEIAWDATSDLGESLGAVPAARDGSGALHDHEAVEGPSPLIVPFPGEAANALGVGNGRDYAVRVFSGSVPGTAPPCLPSPAGCQWGVGVAQQQAFTMVTHVFYAFTPPEGWQFGRDGLPPLPGP